MATLYLIRHGMTDAVGRSLAGWTPGVHLNEEGRAEVSALAAALQRIPLAAVYSSPLERTVETARAVARLQTLGVQIRERLGEVRYGEWTGKTLLNVSTDPRWLRWNEHRAEARCPSGESMLEIQARMIDELLELALQHPRANIAVVSHGDPIRAAVAYFLGMPLQMALRLEIGTASASIVQVEAWGVVVKGVNLQQR